MSRRLVVVTGTGTELGKTHVSEALLLALGARALAAVGLKPIESGVGAGVTDVARLAAASTFHVEPFGVALKAPVSPHRAAREEGVVLPLDDLAGRILGVVPRADVVLVELPGGLFTPLTEAELNADFVARLRPQFLLLVAPDRLGVLHDVLAATRAADAAGVRVDGILLVAPERADASTGSNAADLVGYTRIPVLGVVPRGPVAALAKDAAIAVTVEAMLR